jgi:hypothetical protein
VVIKGTSSRLSSGRCIQSRCAWITSKSLACAAMLSSKVAALPVESAVLDGEAIVMRSADGCDFEALRSREGQAEAILVAYEVDAQDLRPEPLEEPAGSAWRGCYRVATRCCGMAFNSARRSPATVRRSSVTRAEWTSKASSRSAAGRATSAAGRARG